MIRFAIYLYKMRGYSAVCLITVKTGFKILITLFADKINSIN